MTVLLLQPSPTEKLLKRSKFSAVLWIRYRSRLESGGKRRTFDSCFCSRKRSSSSWMRCTKSFSAAERKTPSKQRRARVTGGRAYGATDTAAIKAQNPGPPTAEDTVSPLIGDRPGSEEVRVVPRVPVRTLVGQGGVALVVPRSAPCCLGPDPRARLILPGPEAKGPGGAQV